MSKLAIHNKIKDRMLCLSDLDGTFDDVIKVIQQWKSDYEVLCSEGEWCSSIQIITDYLVVMNQQ